MRMHYINLHFTFLLAYLMRLLETRKGERKEGEGMEGRGRGVGNLSRAFSTAVACRDVLRLNKIPLHTFLLYYYIILSASCPPIDSILKLMTGG